MLGAVLVQKFLLARNTRPPAQTPAPAIGSKVAIDGIDWAQNRKTVVLALQKGCRFCTESASFYQRLTQAATSKGVKVVAVMPQSTAEGRDYLNSLAVPIADIRQTPLHLLNVNATPTLMLVDDKGQVTRSWVGKLPIDKEPEVLAML
jgi:thioredoxin-related protein